MTATDERFYRHQHRAGRFLAFEVRHRETDLWVRAETDVRREAEDEVLRLRFQLESWIAAHPEFASSFSPLPEDPLAPPLIRAMLRGAEAAGVGPMAAVAGAIAEIVARRLAPLSASVIVENGGDCFLILHEDTTVGLYAGLRSPFTGRLALRIPADRFPLSVCTSSGTIGHSFSFGKADAATILAKDGALADAAATAVGNVVKTPEDVEKGLELAASIPGVLGAVVTIEDRFGAWGDVELQDLRAA